ncbi:hypothetical protein E3N88_04885 [Mikania micrantha]|uniref:Uncharacterized protein n=1 Tax=Mikania micrantha TaxID=192012 RepID=A0A5N6PX42_9ASTR|nr:hypothetical protein E3N88_04885 [Mikania micrantha]
MEISSDGDKQQSATSYKMLPASIIGSRMANNEDTNRSSSRRSATDDLTESRRRVHDIVAQVDAEMDRRARDAARARYWPSRPTLLALGERFGGVASYPMRFEFFVRRTIAWKGETIDWRSETIDWRSEMIDWRSRWRPYEHDGCITENRVANEETQAMVQASDAMLNAWAAQFIEEPPQEDGPEFEVNDLGEEDFNEDPEEDPEEDDNDGDAASDISHVSMDSD